MVDHGAVKEPDAGFTLVEVLVAITLLVIGVLSVVALSDEASSATAANKGREGATNLARQVIDDAESIPYAEVDNTSAFTASSDRRPAPW